MRRSEIFPGIGIILFLLCLATRPGALGDDSKLPEETSVLLGKLSAFMAEETSKCDLKIEKAKKSALAILAEHQAEEAELGNLDNVLALREIKTLDEDLTSDPSIPKKSKAVIGKYFDYAEDQRSEILEEIFKKRKAVVRILREQVSEQTKQGNVDMAVAIRDEIGKLESEMLVYSQRDLAEALLKYKWGWHPRGSAVRLQFSEKGTVWHIGMHGKWAIVGERQVLISPADGFRKVLMQFNDDLTSWREVDGEFGGVRYEAQKKKN